MYKVSPLTYTPLSDLYARDNPSSSVIVLVAGFNLNDLYDVFVSAFGVFVNENSLHQNHH